MRLTIVVCLIALTGCSDSATPSAQGETSTISESPASTTFVAPTTTTMAPEVAELLTNDFEVRRRNIGHGTTSLLALEALVASHDRSALRGLAHWLIEQEAGNGWQGVRVDMTTDFADDAARVARFVWAPQGRWKLAPKGNPTTWDGYELGALWGPPG